MSSTGRAQHAANAFGAGGSQPSSLCAIVGLGAVLPGAHDMAAFRASVETARSAIRPPTDGARFTPGAHPELRVGGFVTDVWTLDWRRFHIPPADVKVGNPLSFAALAAGAEALAGVRNLPRETTAIILGATTLGHQRDSGLQIHLDEMTGALREAATREGAAPETFAAIERAATALQARLAPSSSDNVIGSLPSVAAARIAMHFDLYGPHYAVDAGFASAHAAFEKALLGLEQHEWDCVVTGGVSELLTPLVQRAHQARGVVSPAERVRTFDGAGDGTVLGEGVALFALKRLEDALADGDVVHAVVRSATTARAEDPREALRSALEAAYARAGCDLDALGHLECAASGIGELDAAELGALEEALRGRTLPLTLGTSVPEIGHLGPAAGAVAILRAVLELRDETVFPRPSSGEPRALERLPFARVARRAAGWEHGTLAGASALSLSGLAGHVVLERFDPKRFSSPARLAPMLRPSQPEPEPIAIVGLGARFSDANDAEAFHANLASGRDSVVEVPSSRWSLARYSSDSPEDLAKSYGRKGSFVEGLDASPGLDRTNQLALQAALEARADAGAVLDAVEASRVATFVAYMPFVARKWEADTVVIFEELAHELERALLGRASPSSLVEAARRSIARTRAPLGPDSLEGWLASGTAERIAGAIGARGPCLGIESACASTFAAFQAAALALRDGRADLALAGGAFGDLAPEFFVAVSRFRGLSPGGIAPFDARANGFVPGEGAGMFLLERWSDAVAKGHRIRAVLRGIGGSSDGRGRSVLTPSVDGETLAIRRALKSASLEPVDVSYVECHGTGTVLGDAAEAMALGCAYSTEAREGALPIGSVKSNLGHLCAAAGAPAIVKLVLALEHEAIPPMLHHTQPSPRIDFATCGIEPVVNLRPWPKVEGRARVGGASAFGIGGSNFHVLVAEPEAPLARGKELSSGAPVSLAVPSELFAVAAGTAGEALAELERIEHAVGEREFGLVALESRRSATREAARGLHARIAFTARNPAEVSTKLGRVRQAAFGARNERMLAALGVFSATGQEPRGRLALLFPGQGPEYPGMALEASARWPLLDRHLRRADAVWEELAGRPLRPAILGTDPDIAQHFEDLHAAVFAVSTGLAALLLAHGVEPDFLVGQSAGELAALTIAGVLDFESGLRAMHARSRAVQELEGEVGALAIVRAGASQLERLGRQVRGQVYLAADNCPTSCLASGETGAVRELLEACGRAGIEASLLSGYRAYHSPVIAAAGPAYRATLQTLPFAAPRFDVLSTVDLEVYDARGAAAVDRLVRQYTGPARFREAIEALHARGVSTFLECGPKWPLRAYVEDILSGRSFSCHASCHPKVGEVELFQRLLGFAFVNGLGSLEPQEAAPRRRAATENDPLLPGQAADPPQTWQDAVAALDGATSSVGSASRPGAPCPGRQEMEVSVSNQEHEVMNAGDPERLWNAIQRMVVEALAERTGYPEDMLELDVDLEGDLGIDTVKQAEVYSRARQHFGLPAARNLRMRDYNTLRKVIDHMVGRVQGEGASSVVSPPEPARTVPPAPEATPAVAVAPSGVPPAPETEPSELAAPSHARGIVLGEEARIVRPGTLIQRESAAATEFPKPPFVRPLAHQNGHGFLAQVTFTREQAAQDGPFGSFTSPAFVWAALARAAELSSGRRVSEAQQLADYGPIRFGDGAARTLTLVVEGSGSDRVVARALDAENGGGDVVTHEATFRFGERLARGLSPRVFRRLERRGYLDGIRGLRMQAPDVVRFGETSAARLWVAELSEMEAVGGVHLDADEVELACCGESPALSLMPPWLEGIIELTSLAFAERFAEPVALELIEALQLGAAPEPAEETLCYVRLRSLGASAVTVDARAVRLSGLPVATIEGARFVSLASAGVGATLGEALLEGHEAASRAKRRAG